MESGLFPVAYSAGAENVPSPTPRKTATLLPPLLKLPTTRSRWLSLLKLPQAMAYGLLPADEKLAPGVNEPEGAVPGEVLREFAVACVSSERLSSVNGATPATVKLRTNGALSG